MSIAVEENHERIRVKFVGKRRDSDTSGWLRQFPGGVAILGKCEFTFDPDETDYDWYVAYDDLPGAAGQRFSMGQESLPKGRDRSMLITTEPSTIKVYGRSFLRQFGHILTSQEKKVINHPGAIYSQCGLRWFYGVGFDGSFTTYDEMLSSPPENKSKDLSTVCSSKKQGNTVHRLRYEFTQRLREELPDMDVFGHGVRPVNDKAESLNDYRYHIAIENYIGEHHWTEKLSDSFLGLTLPFYYGAPNAADYFPEGSFIAIDPNDFEGSLEIIRETIANGEYEKRLPAIREARRLVMEEYNLFALVAKHVERLHDTTGKGNSGELIYSRRALRKKNWKVGLESFWEKLVSRLNLR